MRGIERKHKKSRSILKKYKSNRKTNKKRVKKKSFKAPLIKRSCTRYTLTFSCFIKKKKRMTALWEKKSHFTKHIQLALRQFLDLSFPSFFQNCIIDLFSFIVHYLSISVPDPLAKKKKKKRKRTYTKREKKKIDGCAREESCTNILRATLLRYTSIEQDNRKEKKKKRTLFFFPSMSGCLWL